MRTLAVVAGAARPTPDRTSTRLSTFLGVLGELGPFDLVVVHDHRADRDERRAWWPATTSSGADRAGAHHPVEPDRMIEVAAPALPRSGFIREVHLRGSDAPERAAKASAWFRLVDSFVASAPTAPDLVWCGDVASLTRAGWIRRSLPAVVDIDRFEDLGSERARRAVRRTAASAHLVTLDTAARRRALGLPGSIVVGAEPTGLPAAIVSVAEAAAAYRPALLP